MTWQVIRVGDLGRIVTGDTPPKNRPELYGSAYPFIKPTDMRIGERYTRFFEDGYSEEGYEKYKNKLIPEGSTAVVTIGSIGQKLTLTHTPCFVNQAVNAVIPDYRRFDPLYVYYLLRHNLHLVKSADTGASSGRENVSKSNFSGLEILVTLDSDEQVRIASILDSYDLLIENNRQRISLLAEFARLLYREWFVDLRFPGHKASTNGDGLPKGWRRGQLDDALFLQRGFDLPANCRKDGEIPIYSSTGLIGYHNEAKVKGPGVVTGRSGTLGVVHYVHGEYWPLNTALWVKEFRAVTPLLAYFMLSDLNLAQLNSGASVPTLDRKVVHTQFVLIPPNEIMNLFENYVDPIFEQVKILQLATDQAVSARNETLPQLMSGLIRI